MAVAHGKQWQSYQAWSSCSERRAEQPFLEAEKRYPQAHRLVLRAAISGKTCQTSTKQSPSIGSSHCLGAASPDAQASETGTEGSESVPSQAENTYPHFVSLFPLSDCSRESAEGAELCVRPE